MAYPKLTPKQKKFCEEYMKELNGTQAAISAGYSSKTAHVIATENLNKPYIKEYISSLQLKLREATLITAEMVINELAKVGFSNVQDFVNGGNSILELKHLAANKTAAVSGVKTTIKNDGDVVTEIKLYDKVSALEKLGRHLGIFEKDNSQANKILTKEVGYGREE